MAAAAAPSQTYPHSAAAPGLDAARLSSADEDVRKLLRVATRIVLCETSRPSSAHGSSPSIPGVGQITAADLETASALCSNLTGVWTCAGSVVLLTKLLSVAIRRAAGPGADAEGQGPGRAAFADLAASVLKSSRREIARACIKSTGATQKRLHHLRTAFARALIRSDAFRCFARVAAVPPPAEAAEAAPEPSASANPETMSWERLMAKIGGYLGDFLCWTRPLASDACSAAPAPLNVTQIVTVLNDSQLLEHLAEIAITHPWSSPSHLASVLEAQRMFYFFEIFRQHVREAPPGRWRQFTTAAAAVAAVHSYDNGTLYGMPKHVLQSLRRIHDCDEDRQRQHFLCWLTLLAPWGGLPPDPLLSASAVYDLAMRMCGCCLNRAAQEDAEEGCEEASTAGSPGGSGSGGGGDSGSGSGDSSGTSGGGGGGAEAIGGTANTGTGAGEAAHEDSKSKRSGDMYWFVIQGEHCEIALKALSLAHDVFLARWSSRREPQPRAAGVAAEAAAPATGAPPAAYDEPLCEIGDDGGGSGALMRPARWWRETVRALHLGALMVPKLYGVLDIVPNAAALVRDRVLGSGPFAETLPARLPASPPPDIAAALSAGLVPALEHFLRGAFTLKSDNVKTFLSEDKLALVGSLFSWPQLGWLMAYGESPQVAALLGTLGHIGRVVRQAAGQQRDNTDLVDLHHRSMQAARAGLEWVATAAATAATAAVARAAGRRAAGDADQSGRRRIRDGRGYGTGGAGGGVNGPSVEAPTDPAGRQVLQLLAFAVQSWMSEWTPVLAASLAKACVPYRRWNAPSRDLPPPPGCIRDTLWLVGLILDQLDRRTATATSASVIAAPAVTDSAVAAPSASVAEAAGAAAEGPSELRQRRRRGGGGLGGSDPGSGRTTPRVQVQSPMMGAAVRSGDEAATAGTAAAAAASDDWAGLLTGRAAVPQLICRVADAAGRGLVRTSDLRPLRRVCYQMLLLCGPAMAAVLREGVPACGGGDGILKPVQALNGVYGTKGLHPDPPLMALVRTARDGAAPLTGVHVPPVRPPPPRASSSSSEPYTAAVILSLPPLSEALALGPSN